MADHSAERAVFYRLDRTDGGPLPEHEWLKVGAVIRVAAPGDDMPGDQWNAETKCWVSPIWVECDDPHFAAGKEDAEKTLRLRLLPVLDYAIETGRLTRDEAFYVLDAVDARRTTDTRTSPGSHSTTGGPA